MKLEFCSTKFHTHISNFTKILQVEVEKFLWVGRT